MAVRRARGVHAFRTAWHQYALDDAFAVEWGHVLLPDPRSARRLAHRLNLVRDPLRRPERAARAGELYAAALLEEVFHLLLQLYARHVPGVMGRALAWLRERLGAEAVAATLARFAQEALAGGETPAAPGGERGDERLLEELITVWLANDNPGLVRYRDLFDDSDLAATTAYREIVAALHDFFDGQPRFGPEDVALMRLLHRPLDVAPHDVIAQLEYVRRAWGEWLERHAGGWLRRAALALDMAREERKPAFAGPGPALVYEYDALREDPEAFSPDREWMPLVVLIAKNTYVWLDQLSKQYGRPIARLDQIPDEELDTLARRGINALWLIGVWERSPASRRIKHLCGNPDAEASAYALFDYRIADALGGEAAFWNLRERAWQRGIRLAGDMVPNHMGIDSPWVMDHPEWFIAVDEPPFPAYTFNGPDLSWREDVGIYLEDHYYDRSDAAVVFKRVDRRTGKATYIYHGNDGTNMPWNDTAQLNHLRADVREALMEQILRVARLFPIIRFDAAMTLTKHHYRRLWFPEPGAGGAIPSRAEHGMSKAEFDRLMPREFWREVVDRVAAEAPDTLLLAEAFWLLEGYFVRTLGMHRVYNSAFMHMLRDEKNAEYRQLIKNTLEFDPEILKRYVHFMNNPDEEPAVVQFGKGDKYFGICTMMVTLPGLPMFGHGQIEGFAEKYGMEYRRAYWEEEPDGELVRRHEREIFPLVRRRHLFAGVEHFRLYDVVTPEGHVDENVFAYSNRAGGEAALVVYHNAFAETRGWIHRSVPFVRKGDDGSRRLVRTTLAEGLGLEEGDEEQTFCLFRDHVTGLEYIRPWRELRHRGLYVELGAYQHHVFFDFRLVRDHQGHYARLAQRLGGRGVPSLDDHLRELELEPVRAVFAELLDGPSLHAAWQRGELAPSSEPCEEWVSAFAHKLSEACWQIARFVGARPRDAVERECSAALALLGRLCRLPRRWEEAGVNPVLRELLVHPVLAAGLHLWAVSRPVGRLGADGTAHDAGRLACERISRWHLFRAVPSRLASCSSLNEGEAKRSVQLAYLLLRHTEGVGPVADGGEGDWRPAEVAAALWARWLDDPEAWTWLHLHEHGGVEWVNKEALEQAAVASAAALASLWPEEAARTAHVAEHLVCAGERAGYRVDRICEHLRTNPGQEN